MRLLLVEDDLPLGDGIRAGLALDGHAVSWVTDGKAADKALTDESYDVVLLDLGLPSRSGLDVLADMRTRGDDTPVLILTARDSVGDRVKGLDTGADDYLTKPFDLDELSARVRALIRRTHGNGTRMLQHGAITLDSAGHLVHKDGVRVGTSRHEFIILRLLLENEGRVLSRARLEEAIYGLNPEIESNTVEVHIHFLRKKLGSDFIRTVRGVGYMIPKAD